MNNCTNCPVNDGYKPAEALHQINEPQSAATAPDERAAFEAWLGIKPCGAAHDFGWAAWQARAALAATQPAAQWMEQDAARYQALVESGDFAPSHFDNCMWCLRAGGAPSTKAELDAAVDRVIAAQAKQGGTE